MIILPSYKENTFVFNFSTETFCCDISNFFLSQTSQTLNQLNQYILTNQNYSEEETEKVQCFAQSHSINMQHSLQAVFLHIYLCLSMYL